MVPLELVAELRSCLLEVGPPCPTFDVDAALPTLLLGEPWAWHCYDDTCELREPDEEPGAGRTHVTGLPGLAA